MSRKTRTKSKTRNNAKSRAKKATVSTVKSIDTEETVIPTAEPAIIKEEVAQPEPKEEIKIETPVEENQVIEQPDLGPRRSVVFIGSECYPFVKTGGLGDVMSALPKSLAKLNVDVKVILPRYKCIPWEYQEKMEYKGSFYMDLCSDGRQYYVGIMEYQEDGVIYDFIDNEEFFSWGNPYTNLIDDIPKFCYCHDWQAALVPLYLRTCFADTNVGRASAVLTIHNLKFQGIYDRKMIQYWSGLPDYVFNKDCLTQNWLDANMLKGGITYCNRLTTVSNTYAGEIQTEEYGEGLAEHLRYHQNKIRGIVNGIDYNEFNPETDPYITKTYNETTFRKEKVKNKLQLQRDLGLQEDPKTMMIGIVSRLTDQKGFDLIAYVMDELCQDAIQLVILGTGDERYENMFRHFDWKYHGKVSAQIYYDEKMSHRIYASADAFLMPSLFEPCGLSQLMSLRYGTLPIVRETGGLKDTVVPYNEYEGTGNGFSFRNYNAHEMLATVRNAERIYYDKKREWNKMVDRAMAADFSWGNSARQYEEMYNWLIGDK